MEMNGIFRVRILRWHGFAVSLVLMSFLGCGSDDHVRINELEARIAQLEREVHILERAYARRPSTARPPRARAPEVSVRPVARPTPEQIEERQRLRQEVRKRIEERQTRAREEKARMAKEKEANDP